MGAVEVERRGRGRRAVERLQPQQTAADGRELSAQDGVLKQQRRQSGRDRHKVGPCALDLAFHFHPPVLEPRFNLGDATVAI